MSVSDGEIEKAGWAWPIVLAVLGELESETDQDHLALARFPDEEGRSRQPVSEKDYPAGLLQDARKVPGAHVRYRNAGEKHSLSLAGERFFSCSGLALGSTKAHRL